VGLGLFYDVLLSHSLTYILLDSPGGVIDLSQRPLPDSTQHSQETHVHDLGGIRTRNPNKRTVTDSRIRLSEIG